MSSPTAEPQAAAPRQPDDTPPSPRLRAGAIAATLIACVAVFAPAVVGIPLYTKGEPREALVMQTILRTGELALPLRNDGEIPSKPPLFHWIGAAASLPGGEVTETTAKLPSTIASLATIAATMLFALRYLGTAQAILAAVVGFDGRFIDEEGNPISLWFFV